MNMIIYFVRVVSQHVAPVIFNLFLVAVTLVFRHNISAADGVRIKYRLDGSLFNIRRLQAVTKVTNDTIFDLQYADDAALPSHTPDGLQRQLDANLLCILSRRTGG